MQPYLGVPDGTRDRVYTDAEVLRERENTLAKLFASHGYREISTPCAEYYDLFVETGSPLRQEAVHTLSARNGRILVLRPDSTIPLARVAATRLASQPLPLRLYCCQSIFRSDSAHNGHSTERRQAGIELIGASGADADLEIITLAVDALKKCGAENCRIELGHAGLLGSILRNLDVDNTARELIHEYIEQKNFAMLDDCLPQGAHADALRRMTRLFGGAEVFDDALDLGNDEANNALNYLKLLYSELSKAGLGKHIIFDLGLVNQLEFYTGVIFHGYTQGIGEPVLSGGRYDNLLGRLGRDAAATGFAINIDAFDTPADELCRGDYQSPAGAHCAPLQGNGGLS